MDFKHRSWQTYGWRLCQLYQHTWLLWDAATRQWISLCR